MVELFINSGEPDQTLHFAASDLGLHYFPITLLGVSRLQRVIASSEKKTLHNTNNVSKTDTQSKTQN